MLSTAGPLSTRWICGCKCARARMEAIIEWAWQYFTGEHPGQIVDR
jgi:hypothetical protein